MNKNVIGVVVVLVIGAGAWYVLSATPAEAPALQSSDSLQTPAAGSLPETAVATEVTVTYTDQGFSPASVTVAQGQTVIWVNQSSGSMWVASAAHPTHTAYSGTSLSEHCPDTANAAFDACAATAPGESFSFTFDKAGTWKYHDHTNASRFGSVIVTAPAKSI